MPQADEVREVRPKPCCEKKCEFVLMPPAQILLEFSRACETALHRATVPGPTGALSVRHLLAQASSQYRRPRGQASGQVGVLLGN